MTAIGPRRAVERWSDAVRLRRVRRAAARDTTPPPPSAFRRFGAGSWLVPPCRVSEPEHITIGDGVVILEHAWLSVVSAVGGLTPSLRIGDGTRIGRFAHIACVGEIEIGRGVLTSDRVFIGDTYHGYEDPAAPVIDQPMAAPAPVRIGDGAFLGIGCAVLLGVTVGDGAYVGAGAVVTADVPPRTVVVGNPARPVKRWDAGRGVWRNLAESP